MTSTGDFGGQSNKAKEKQQWIEYDSNVAEVDGSLHVFSDTAVSNDEEAGAPRVREKYVLLDRVPQVSSGSAQLFSQCLQSHVLNCSVANVRTSASEMFTVDKRSGHKTNCVHFWQSSDLWFGSHHYDVTMLRISACLLARAVQLAMVQT